MNRDAKYLSDSELHRSNVESKRRRNESAESHLLLGLGSHSDRRNSDDSDTNETVSNSRLSIESIRKHWLNSVPRQRKDEGTEEIEFNASSSVSNEKEVSISIESLPGVIENESHGESPVETSDSMIRQKRSCSFGKDNTDLYFDSKRNGGESHLTLDIERDLPTTPDKDCELASEISGCSKLEVDSRSSTQSRESITNKPEIETWKPPMIHIENSTNMKEENPRESSIVCQEPCQRNSHSIMDLRPLSQDPTLNESEIQTGESKLFKENISDVLEENKCETLQNSDDILCQESSMTRGIDVSASKPSYETHELKCGSLQNQDITSASDIDKIEEVLLDVHGTSTRSEKNLEELTASTKGHVCERFSANSDMAMSSPYQTLGDKSTLSETIIGQPRCLTLKQYNAYANTLSDYELDFDFEITDDIDDDLVSSKEQQLENGENSTKGNPDPNDMFQDDDTDVIELQNIPCIDLASPTLCGRVRECSNLEKEEGELTPESHSIVQTDLGESSSRLNPKISSGKESNLEFFSKVNKCFFQLDKEFNNIRIPRDSKKLVLQLQDTLKIVKRMDRKLSLLIESVNGKSNKDKKLKLNRYSMAASGRNLKGTEINNASGRKDTNSVSDRFGSRSSEQRDKQESHHHDSKTDPNSEFTRSRHGVILNTSESRDSQSIHDGKERRKVSNSETKREKQRIQSLFKRQMNLITRHVVQKNKIVKRHVPKPEAFGKSSEEKPSRGDAFQKEKDPAVSQKLPNLDQVKTLEDMEAFFEMLKEKRDQKSTSKEDDVVDYKEKNGVLKFTTKKNTHSEWRSIIESAAAETKKKMASQMVPGTKMGDNALREKENHLENSKETVENRNKEISKSRKELDKQLVKKNAGGSDISDLLRFRNSMEQRHVKRRRETSAEGIKFQNGDDEEPNDSFSVKINPKEKEPFSERRVSDFEADDSSQITSKNSKKRRTTKKRESSSSKSSESDSRQDRIPKRRRRKRVHHSISKLSPESAASISKSQSRSRYRSKEEGEEGKIDYFRDRLPSELKPQNLFIVADKNLSLLDKHFCLKVRGNQIFLQTTGKSRFGRHEFKSERISRKRKISGKTDNQPRFDPENAGTTLKEMEDFLQQLRSKKVAGNEHQEPTPSSLQSKEAKFMARIQAKRKAKLMACMSEAPTITEKEAKFLKDLEKRAREPCDSPETLHKKQELMQKIRAETDAIVLAQKQFHNKNANSEEDPLSDVKTILSMIREAESGSDANSRQFLVSFPLKKSDVKQLESITAGKTLALSEESQRFLNSVRAKMRAKKSSAVATECADQKQSQKD